MMTTANNHWLTDTSIPALNEAIEANYAALLTAFAAQPNACIHTTPDYTLVSNPVYSPFYNGVVNARLTEENADAAIEATVEIFRERGTSVAFWWMFPNATPVDLEQRLLAHGFLKWGDDPGMWVDLMCMDETLKIPPNFRLEVVHDERMLNDFISLLISVFHMPVAGAESWRETALAIGMDRLPYTFYVGYLDDQPVAINAIMLGGGVAGAYAVGVIPEMQRRGLGKAVTVLPFAEARVQGCRIGVLFSSEAGYPVYQKIGFSEFCHVRRYRWQP
jgi:hypothetical protein